MVVDAILIQTDVGIVDAAFEVLVVLAVVIAPTDFGDGDDARERTVVADGFGVHIFGPAVALYAQHVRGLAHRGQCVGQRVVAIRLFEGGVTADGDRLNLRVALIMVEVHTVSARCHDDTVVHERGSDTALFATP